MLIYHLNIIWGCLLLLAGMSHAATDGCAYTGASDIDLFLPHTKYCNLFYRLDKCPNGLVFNPSAQQCDLPANTNCGSKQILTPGGSGGDQNDRPNPTGRPPIEGGFSFIGGACPPRTACPQANPNQRIFVPHSTACNLFCSCEKGASLLYKCDKGLHFNPRTRSCDYPTEAGCTSGGSSGGNQLTTVVPPIEDGWRRPFSVGGQCRPKGTCPPNGQSFLPHESACNLLCGCENGRSVLYSCPRRLHFNAASKLCDIPDKAGCNSNGPGEESVTEENVPIPTNPEKGTRLGGTCISSETCPGNIPAGTVVFLPHLTVCNLFCACDGTKLELYACPNDLYFNPKTQGCHDLINARCNPVPPHKTNPKLIPSTTGNGDCLTIQTCPANDPSDFTIYLPHATDCGFFCRCERGVAKLHKCGEGLNFNPRKQSCDVRNDELCKTTTSVGGNNNGGNGNTGNVTTGGQLELCPAEGTCPQGRNDYLPHQRSCVLFCECVSGIPRLRQCSAGLHFNPKNKKCEAPNKALCQGDCGKLERRDATTWSPSTCTSRLSKLGDVCGINCAKGYELRGSKVIVCSKQGWNGTAGLANVPSCKAPEEVGVDIITNVEEQAKGDVNFLFILDESLSLSEQEFLSEHSFIKAVVGQFPLSGSRTAGVITFSGSAAVDIPMTQTDSCRFFQEVDKIQYSGGSTDILLALRTAIQEVATYSKNKRTLVFLITDGQSETNPTSAANDLKQRGHVLFTIGVGEYDRKQLEPLSSLGNDGVPLFFGLTNFKAFGKIAEYLHTVHGYGANLKCARPNIAV